VITPDVAELLAALGPEPEQPRQRKRTPRQIILEAMETRENRHPVNLVEGDFSNRQFPYLSTAKASRPLEFAANFAGANLMYCKFIGSSRIPGPGPILSGLFFGTHMEHTQFVNASLTGDFSNARFAGASFKSCLFAGNFDGSDFSGVSMKDCTVHGDASFCGADLRDVTLGFHRVHQILGAVVSSRNSIGVLHGTTQLMGEQYTLIKPAQWLCGVVVHEVLDEPDEKKRELRTAFVIKTALNRGCVSPDCSKALMDISHRPIKCDDSNAFCANRIVAYAPGTTFTNIRKRIPLYLKGDFSGAKFADCTMSEVRLCSGSFQGLDLTKLRIKSVCLEINNINVQDIKFPNSLKNIDFILPGPLDPPLSNNLFRNCSLPMGPARDFLEAWTWNNPKVYERLAEKFLRAAWKHEEKSWLGNTITRIMSSTATKIDELTSLLNRSRNDLYKLATGKAIAGLGLIARRNRL
jgi:uncharacterized protein YjbI with pentapeptide repeats